MTIYKLAILTTLLSNPLIAMDGAAGNGTSHISITKFNQRNKQANTGTIKFRLCNLPERILLIIFDQLTTIPKELENNKRFNSCIKIIKEYKLKDAWPKIQTTLITKQPYLANVIINTDPTIEQIKSNLQDLSVKTTINSLFMDAIAGNDETIKSINTVINVGIDDSHDKTLSMRIKIIETLLLAGADVDEARKGSWTALMWAAAKDYTEIIQILLLAGADVNFTDVVGNTALTWAAHNGCSKIVKILLLAGADINAANKDGETALIWAAKCSTEKASVDTINVLLQAGAKIDSNKNYGSTELIQAIFQNQTNKVEALLAANFNANAKDYQGETALMHAAKLGHTKIVKILLTANANINTTDEREKPALLTAAEPEPFNPIVASIEIINTLLQAGANMPKIINCYDEHTYKILKQVKKEIAKQSEGADKNA